MPNKGGDGPLFWPFAWWCRTRANVTPKTAWTWRKKKLLEVTEINDRKYVTPGQEADFLERVGASSAPPCHDAEHADS